MMTGTNPGTPEQSTQSRHLPLICRFFPLAAMDLAAPLADTQARRQVIGSKEGQGRAHMGVQARFFGS